LGGLAIHGSFLQAQNTDYVDSSQVQVLADTGKSYLVPDLSHKQMKWTNIGNKYFTLQLGFVMLFDYDQNIQDEDSKTQVGKQESRFDLRSARVMARGKINFKNPWSYLISLEYKGLDRGDDVNAFGFTDLKLLVPLSKHSELTFGKIKETFVYEMVGDAANLPQSERILNPFFASRNTGIVYRHFLLNDRMTISGGWFNNWLAKGGSLSESVNTYTARVTGLPKWVNNGKQFMHMGVSIRYLGAQNGMERLQGKNESNVSTNYVDTKSFSASHQLNLGFEQLWSLENFSVLFEYVHNWTKTPTGSEQFSGSYVTGSYVISGEQRPYDKKAGYARRIKPTGKSGAWEIIARISKLDLDNRDIHGGINNRYTFGLNWWATQYWKAGMTYGITNLLKDNILGVTNSFQFRIQWIF
jgi:phosphate-selective porin